MSRGEQVFLERLLPVEHSTAAARVLLSQVDGRAVFATDLLLGERLGAVGTLESFAAVDQHGLHSSPVVRLKRGSLN